MYTYYLFAAEQQSMYLCTAISQQYCITLQVTL